MVGPIHALSQFLPGLMRPEGAGMVHDRVEAVKWPEQAARTRSPTQRYRDSAVAVGALVPLVAFLRLDTEGRDGAGFQTANADGLGCLLAIAVGAVLEPL